MREDTYGIPAKYKPLLTLLLRKIMASSSYALGFTLSKIIHRLEEGGYNDQNSYITDLIEDYDTIEEENSYNESESNDSFYSSDLSREIQELREYQRIAFSIKDETKAQKLLEALSLGFKKLKNLGANEKALIFTESRRTQEYLYKFLNEHGYKDKVVNYNGTNNDETTKEICKKWMQKHKRSDIINQSVAGNKKQAIIDYFKNEANILIATEAGAEGLNLQFCSLIVNYDMPWNPQRVEQRIGRCHRYGQEFDVVVINFVNKTNQAEQRIYELLNEKFNLFSGVFGSSDEILGSLESGVDFEKRLLNIYQHCRTSIEIQSAFDELQNELEKTINERINQTKKSLLENFDEEVIEKMKIRQSNDIKRVNNYQRHFWNLAKAMLSTYISDINDNTYSFNLLNAPADNIPIGEYILNKDCGDKHQLRLSHPLGEYLINMALSLRLDDQFLCFDINSSPYKQSLLCNYKGKKGYTIGYLIKSSNEYDNEEKLIMSSQTSEGECLPDEFAEKMFELNSKYDKYNFPFASVESLQIQFDNSLNKYKIKLQKKTEDLVNEEIEKYEDWERDNIIPIENELVGLRNEYEAMKRLLRKEHNIVKKLELKEQENSLHKRVKQKQRALFDLQDEYCDRIDEMTEKFKKSMNNKYDISVIFRFGWELK